jgi:hypothetical protein
MCAPIEQLFNISLSSQNQTTGQIDKKDAGIISKSWLP